MKTPPHSLQHLSNRLAWAVSLAIALLAPTAFYLTSYQYMRGVMEAQTELRSRDISRVINANPVMWRFEEVRLSELLERRSTDDIAEMIRISDSDGVLVAKNTVAAAPPLTTYSHNIYDVGAVAARIEVSRSLRPLLFKTLLTAVGSAALAFVLFFALRILPQKALQNAFLALSASESKYRSLYDTMKEGMALHRFTRDADGIRTSLSLIDANPSCIALLGRDRQKIIGSDSLALFGEGFRRHFQELAQVEEHKGHASFELAMPENKYYIVHAFSPEQDHVATLFEDITARKKAEGERLNLERKLLHAQKLESLGVLSGGIAHDFNNLLHVVLGNLDLALMKSPGDADVRQHIDQAVSAGKQAARLTDMILAYTGKKMYVIQKVNLTALVEKNASMLSALVSRRVTFDLALDGGLPPIMADEGQMQQVVMNLITNASEAIGDAVGTIRLATRVQEFDQSALNASRVEEKPTAGRYVVLEVRDNGCGMDSETLHRLFDPFFTTKFTGRGLGMSAVQGIIRAHQGAFLIESSPGAGTAIRVLFPMASAPQTVESITAPPARDAAANRDRWSSLLTTRKWSGRWSLPCSTSSASERSRRQTAKKLCASCAHRETGSTWSCSIRTCRSWTALRSSGK
jgi:signal transduction histidine kinase